MNQPLGGATEALASAIVSGNAISQQLSRLRPQLILADQYENAHQRHDRGDRRKHPDDGILSQLLLAGCWLMPTE